MGKGPIRLILNAFDEVDTMAIIKDAVGVRVDSYST